MIFLLNKNLQDVFVLESYVGLCLFVNLFVLSLFVPVSSVWEYWSVVTDRSLDSLNPISHLYNFLSLCPLVVKWK